MVLIAVTCPYCQSDLIAKRGKTDTGKQRYRCQNPDCPHPSFLLRNENLITVPRDHQGARKWRA